MVSEILPAAKHLMVGMGKELLGPVLFAYRDPVGIQFLPNVL